MLSFLYIYMHTTVTQYDLPNILFYMGQIYGHRFFLVLVLPGKRFSFIRFYLHFFLFHFFFAGIVDVYWECAF